MSDDNVINFPKEKVYPREVRGFEIWAQPEPPSEMVWAICPYLRSNQDDPRCNNCPPLETDVDYGDMTRGCYVFAAEACRVVFAMQARNSGKPE